MSEPEGDSYSDVKDRVDTAVKSSEPGRGYAETARNLSVIDVADGLNEYRSGDDAAVAADGRNDDDDRCESESKPGNTRRQRVSKFLSRVNVRHVTASALTLVIIWIALTRLDWRTISHAVLRASVPLLLATMVMTFASTALKSMRWWIFLRSRTQLRFSFVFRLTTASAGMNALLVANAGDIMRVQVAAKHAKVGRRVIVGSLVCDKVVEVLAFATLAALTIAIVDTPWLPARGIVIGAASIVLFLLAWLASNKAKDLRGRAGAMGYALSLISWLTQIVTYSLAARAVGLTLPITATMAALVAVNLGGVFRITPGNIGVYQAMYVVALTPFGVPSSQAVGAALLTQSAQIISGAIAGAIATIRLSSFALAP